MKAWRVVGLVGLVLVSKSVFAMDLSSLGINDQPITNCDEALKNYAQIQQLYGYLIGFNGANLNAVKAIETKSSQVRTQGVPDSLKDSSVLSKTAWRLGATETAIEYNNIARGFLREGNEKAQEIGLLLKKIQNKGYPKELILKFCK